MRICSLLPSATEIAFALGLGDQVVGVTHECDYPPEAKEKPVLIRGLIGHHSTPSRQIDRAVSEHRRTGKSLYRIDLARFREVNPDLILTQELCSVCAVDHQEVMAAATLLSRKPKMIALAPRTLADMLRDVTTIGEATGREKEAEDLVSHMRERLEGVKRRASRSDVRPRVACVEWLDPLYSAGHWVPEMVHLAGGTDGMGKRGEESQKIDWARFLEYAPEIIILMPCGFDVERTLSEVDLLSSLPDWNKLPAIKEGQLFAVNGSAYFSRSGPRLIEGLEILAQILHPELFPWRVQPAEARRVG